MGTAQTEVDEREIKGGNQTSTKSSIITIHASSKKKRECPNTSNDTAKQIFLPLKSATCTA